MLDHEVNSPESEDQDELDNWFDEDEEEEDQSADEVEPEAEETSAEASSEDNVPDGETPEENAPEASSAGTSDDPQPEDPYGWIEKLDPDLRKHAEALVQRDRSNSGRAAATQARLDEANARLEAQRLANAGTPSPEAGTSDAPEDDLTDEGLSEFVEAYPTVAENMQRMIEAKLARQRKQFEKELTPLKQKQTEEAQLRERQVLRHNAEIIFNSAETGITLEDVTGSDAWKDWLNAQPEGYRKYANSASNAQDATKVLEDFANHAERQAYLEYTRQQEAEAANNTSDADQVAARREDAKAGTGVPSNSAPGGEAHLSTYEDWFNHYADS